MRDWEGRRHRDPRPGLGTQGIDPHWPGDVLDLPLAKILEGVIELVPHLVPNDPADTDPAGFGQPLQPGRDIHTVAEDIMFLSDHVAEIDPDTEPDPALLRHLGLAQSHSPLHLHSTTDGIHHTRKFRQEAVAGVLHDAASMLLDLRIDQFAEMRLEPLVRPLLLRTH